MQIDFHPDVVAVRLQQIDSARQADSTQRNDPDEKATLGNIILSASTTIYNLHGKVGLSTNKPGTLLNAYTDSKDAIERQLSLLKANLINPLPLGTE